MAEIHNSSSSARPPSALAAQVCLDLVPAAPPLSEIHRHLGYTNDASPTPHIANRIQQVVAETQPLLRPRGVFAIYGITARTANSLAFADTAVTGQVAEFLAAAERLAVFVATVGDEVSQLAAQQRAQGDTLAECIIDAFASCAAEAATDALMLRIERHLASGEALTLRYSPGYCGMALEQQQLLFQLVQAEAIGVSLLPSMLMYPLKSVSGIVGMAPKEKVSTYRAPCDRCDRVGCHMRR